MALNLQPPATRLRPLHTHSYDSSQTQQESAQLLQWTSSLGLEVDESSAIRAFLKVVARLVVLGPGETYCIQDVNRGGYIEATALGEDAVEAGNGTFLKIVEYAGNDGISTDFSIGTGKPLQLHFHPSKGLIKLVAYASFVPLAALEAIGSMLEDILQGSQKGQPSGTSWTRPSVLNFPPASVPLPIRPRQAADSESSNGQGTNGVIHQQPLLHQWFSQRAAEAPHAVALDYLLDLESGKRVQYTYQQVENASNALVKALTHLYETIQSPASLKAVAVLIGPSPEMYISYLASLKAGMAFCPVAHDLPKERQEALLADLNPVAILIASSSPALSSPTTGALVDTTPYLTSCDVKVDGPQTTSALTTTSASAAYVLYTSGTTGMPKGVIISHASAACTISALSAHYGFDLLLPPPSREPIRWFQGAAPTFDISIFEIFWTLSTGSTLCCAPRKLTLQNLDKVVTTLKADITNITPSFASVLDPSSIRGLMLGGESLTTHLIQDFAPYNAPAVNGETYKPTGLFNGYGPTETAIYCIAQAHVPLGQRGSVIGTPLSTCGVLIVDETTQHHQRDVPLEPVPMGAIGELIITGPQVSSFGYLSRAAETASAFADDSVWGRVYKTGDRARIVWDDRGDHIIEFLGRISDDQVKLSGRRVELAEIDNVLAGKVPEILETLSVVWKQPGSSSGSEKVVSLVVLKTPSNPDFRLVETKCLDAARQHLPDYMRPFRILEVQSLPKSASGKKSRAEATAYVLKHLQNLGVQQTEHSEDGGIDALREPKDAKLESELLEIALSLLGGKHPITAATSLADAGMDSLLAMRFLRDIRKRWPDAEPNVNDELHSRLQPSLARLLDSKASIRSVFFSSSTGEKQEQARLKLSDFSARHMPEVLEKLNLNQGDIELVLPTTSTQSQLAVSFAMDSRNYISHSVLRLKEGVSVEALQQSIESVVSEQPIYRTAMIPCDDTLCPLAQVVLSPEAWKRFTGRSSRITHQKLRGSDSKYGLDSWADIAAANMSLEANTLYQIQIIEGEEPERSSGGSSGLLVISAAHCICDGASVELLLADIANTFVGQQLPRRNNIYDTVLDWVSGLDPATDQMWQTALDGSEVETLGALSGNNIELARSQETKDYGMMQFESKLSWQELESKSRALSATPLSIIQAAWSVLINLLSEADAGDVTFGSVVSGHHTSTHAPDFSVVPCRVALAGSQTVRDLLRLLVDEARQAQTHRHTSFGIFKTLPYNTVLALQAYSALDLDGDSAQGANVVPWTDVHTPAIRYDLAIFAEVLPRDSNEGLTFKITYRDDTLSSVSAACVASQFAGLVETFLRASPDDLVQTLPGQLPRALLSAEGEVPETCQNLDGPSQLLHSQFERQAAATPDLLALSFYTSLDEPPVEMSYQELDARANGLAIILREQNSAVIPICMQRSVELYISILAILKAGSAWCPIDETSPIQRRTSLISRTQAKILLTNKESLHLVEPCLAQGGLEGWRVLILDEYANHQTHVRPSPRSGTLSSDGLCGKDLAYLLWTSGTTGEPKGVMIQHFAASQAMRDLQVQVEHDDSKDQVRTLQLSSYSFDVFVQDLFYTWGLAGCVVSGTRELVLGTFVEFIWKSKPTHAHLTPSFGASIAVDEIKGSTLQYVTFIGEKLTEDVAEAWAAPDITTRVYNTYGPAENAVVSTMRRVHGKSRDLAKAANVGFPLNPCTAYVVRPVDTSANAQSRWELVPRYGVGELALGGLQVGKGYLGDETKTAKAFIHGAQRIDERIYLTGDTVRLNDHGFEFLGRNDDLVKITGIRIELSEISAACATVKTEQPAMEHVETLYLPHPESAQDSQKKVVVTFVSVKTSDADTGTIRTRVFQRAREMLPSYMVPGHVVVLDRSMPRTASNKVDRKALQEIYKNSDLNILAGRGGQDPSDENDAPKTAQWDDARLSIVKIVAAHLHINSDHVSPDDTLAGLGLSSLQITKLAWYLKRELQCAIGVLRLMRCQLLGELIDTIADALHSSEVAASTSTPTSARDAPAEKSWLITIKDELTRKLTGPTRPQDTEYVVPATPMQESLLVETMLEPGAYWTHRVFDLSSLGEIDGQRLQRAWHQAATKFDILRSVFFPLTQFDIEGSESSLSWARQQGIPCTMVQLVRGSAAVSWSLCPLQDLRGHALKLQTDLMPSKSMSPPWAVTLVEKERKLMLSMHHALYDGVSSEMLLDAVAKLYMRPDSYSLGDTIQFVQGLELGLLPTASERDEAASSWSGQLEELRQAAGPMNGPFPDLTQSRQKQPQKILSSKKSITTSFIQQESRGPSLPILFQSAFGCILAAYMELKAVVIGQTMSQRIIHPDLADVMGPAIATLPVIIRANSSSSSELWASMSRDSATFSHVIRHLHPVDLKKVLNHGNDSSNTPLPGLFVYHPALDDEAAEFASPAKDMFREEDLALSLNVEHPLALNIFEAENAIELTGDMQRISQGQLDIMLQQIIELAQAMTESPDLSLDQLRYKLGRSLVSVSGEATNTPPDMDNPSDTVSRRARQTPDWIAAEELIFEESNTFEDTILTKTITYGQLDALVNGIASRLSAHEAHLGSNDVVAMHMGRDITSLAVILAIFRAGYVYLPVDEDMPRARKELIIRDSNAKLVITTADLKEELSLDSDGDPPVFVVQDGEDAINTKSSWAHSQEQNQDREGGYLLYTSGSTGRPKGVRVSNSNLCSFIAAFSARLIEFSPATAALGNAGKYLNLTSRAFDPHLTQMFVPWHLGHRVVIGKDRNSMIANLEQVLNHFAITHFGSVPSVLTKMGLTQGDVPSVRVITTGGEKASAELLDTWSKQDTDAAEDATDQVTLFNFYGPTEVTIGCLGHAVNHHSNPRNLGLPFNGLEAILLCPDTGSEPVIAMRGQPGELCITGPQVAMGYLDRPEENEKSFRSIALPGLGPDRRVYKTGDMMRMMHDGTLEFLGRIDQQAKIRGQRLELGEVVSFLKEAAVDEGDLDFAAAVTSNPYASNQQLLLAFIARGAKSLLKRELQADAEVVCNMTQTQEALLQTIVQKCETGLPAFMVPTLVWVSRIPYLAASGKVDTKQLTKLANDFFHSQEASDKGLTAAAPSLERSLDARETAVAGAVEEVVGRKITATAKSLIAQLGIDSLSAVHLVSILRKRGFSNVTMSTLLAPACTIESLAQSSNGDSSSFSNAGSLDPPQTSGGFASQEFNVRDLGELPSGLKEGQIETILPCLPLQAALVARSLSWANAASDEHTDSQNVPYVAQFQYHLAKETDLPRWKLAFEQVVASEAMLRTCFVQRDGDGKIFQVVLASPASSLFESQSAAIDIVREMNCQPPFRVELDESDATGQSIVTLRIHHALFDGVGLGVLRQKVAQLYDSDSAITIPRDGSLGMLKQVTTHCQLSTSQIESAKLLWQKQLQNVQPCHVASVSNGEINSSMARSTLRFQSTTTQLKASLQAQPHASGAAISLSCAFQLATALCLARITQREPVVYGFVLSLRPLLSHAVADVDSFAGPCLNTVIQTTRLQSTSQTLPQLAETIDGFHRAVCQGPMSFVPVEAVQRWAGSEEKLFDSLLSINIVEDADAETAESRPGVMHAVRTKSKSDMALAIDVDLHTDGRIDLTLSSNGALHEQQLQETAQLFEKIVCSAANPRALVGDFVPEYQSAPTAVALNGTSAFETLGSTFGLTDDSKHAPALGVGKALCRFLQLPESEVLDKPRSTSLYQMGLDSITVLPFIKILASSTGLRLTADSVIKARTIQGLVDLVHEAKAKTRTAINGIEKQQSRPTQRASDDGSSYDKTLSRLASGLLFLATPLQEGMLSASFAIAEGAYTYTHTIQLSESALKRDTLSLDYFTAAVKDTVQVCEILRTRFVFTQDDDAPWVGFVSPTEKSDLFTWEFVADKPGRAQFKIHHALYDAASISLLWRILDEKYQDRLEGRLNADKEGAAYSFRPFARIVASAQHTSQTFWTDIVRNYTYTPFDIPTNSLQASSTFRLNLREQTLSSLQTRCRELDVTLKAALHVAWATVLCQSLYGQSDVVFGETVSTAGNFDATQDGAMVGPTINTVPMRVSLVQNGGAASFAEALALVQNMGDEIRGLNSMASLRKIQSIWRSSTSGDDSVPPTLFQSLFVFDGIVSSSSTAQQLFWPVQADAQNGASTDKDEGGPVYDDYPLIANFFIRDGALCGKLRAKMSVDAVATLGKALEAALEQVAFGDLQQPAIDMTQTKALGEKLSSVNGTHAYKPDRPRDMASQPSKADAVLDIVKSALGAQGKTSSIDYDTKLLRAGLDSILAIRLASALRKKLGINVSVFQIMKGASVRDIAQYADADPQPIPKKQVQTLPVTNRSIHGLIAKRMNLPEERISSVLPALSGQRAHLEQWMFHGRRFFEAPWVYRAADDVDKDKIMRCWNELIQVHEILRTTFVWADKNQGLFQVTLGETEDSGTSRFKHISNVAVPIKTLVDEHVRDENAKPSDMAEPPARLSFLEGSDGKAVVLRLHHALYDAWSIKLIESDLMAALSTGNTLPSRTPLALVMQQIAEARQPEKEDHYWTQHLARAQDTLLLPTNDGEALRRTTKGSHGPHTKARYDAIVPQDTTEALSRAPSPSAALILAFAKTLSQFTQQSRPAFGLNHASRFLACEDGAQQGGLDLTTASVPTLTVTPFSIDLERQGDGVAGSLASIQEHLTQLSRFSQSDNVRKSCPKFNAFVNIMYVDDADMQGDENADDAAPKALTRWRLGEPLASEYFTTAKPSLSAAPLVDGLDLSHLGPCQMFFTIIVQKGQRVSVALSGDESLLGGGEGALAENFALRFGEELVKIVDGLSD